MRRTEKFLVLGSNSFSGASFCAHLLQSGYEVFGGSRSVEPHKAFLPYKWGSNQEQFSFSQLNLNEDLKNEQLQLLIRKDGFELASSKAGLLKHIPKIKNGDETAYDFESLSKVLQDVKRLLPDKDDITILLEPSTSYQTLVTAMDTTRSYKAVLVASVVDAALFPDISLGDAPTLVAKPSNVGNQQESQ